MRNINKIHIVLIILFLSLATINSYACIPIPPDGWNDDNDSGDPCDPTSCEYDEAACNNGDCSALDGNDSGDPCDPASCQYNEATCNNGDCSALDDNDSGDPCDPTSCQYSPSTCNNGDCSALDNNDSGDPCDPTSCQYSPSTCNNGDCSALDSNDSGDPCDPASCQYSPSTCNNGDCSALDDNDSGDPCDPTSCQYNVATCNNGDCSALDDNDSGDPCDATSCQYNMAECNPCLDFPSLIGNVLNFEGGFVNDPNDPGGATNRGITWDTWQSSANSLGLEPTLENLKNLSEEDAIAIYKQLYWDKINADEINDGDIRYLLFDFYVNAGNNAIKTLQNTLNQLGYNITVDGKMGTQTINAINSTNYIDLYNAYKQNRINYYIGLASRRPSLNKFLNGWKNRTNKFKNKTTDNSIDVNCNK